MKITLCGSMHFAKEMLETQKILKKMGNECLIVPEIKDYFDNPNLNMDYDYCIENDCQMDHFNKINESDAILVLNYTKNNINNYIGGATLMEIGLAYFLGKKIFILNDIPDEKTVRYAFEVKLSQPTILKGDLSKIK